MQWTFGPEEKNKTEIDFNAMGERLLERTLKLVATTRDHRHFYNRLQEELKRAERYSHDLSMAIFDVDDFKNYNDRNGHLKGDELLKMRG